MLVTTPAEVSLDILEFCEGNSPTHVPVFVSVDPLPDAETNFCFYNAKDVAERRGSNVAFGWTIWEMRDVYLEREHHAVWEDEGGRLADVTPKQDGEDRILFLPDPKSKFYFSNPKWRDNFRKSLVPDQAVLDYLNAAKKLQCFQIRYSKVDGRSRLVHLKGNKARKLDELQQDFEHKARNFFEWYSCNRA